MSNWQPLYNPRLQRACATLPGKIFKEERWYADRGTEQQLILEDSLQFGNPSGQTFLSFNLFRPESRPGYFYFIPLLALEQPGLLFQREHFFENEGFFFYDGIATPEYIHLIEDLLARGGVFNALRGKFYFKPLGGFFEPGFAVHGRSSNSLLFVTHQYLIKNYRRLYPGANPELTLYLALTKLQSDEVPAILGSIVYQASQEYTLGIVQQFIANQGSGWEVWGELLAQSDANTEEILFRQAYRLGTVMAGLHRKLAQIARAEQRIQPLTLEGLRHRFHAFFDGLSQYSEILKSHHGRVIATLRQFMAEFSESDLGQQFRIHGDLHLEQVLKTEPGWKVIDFEGEPLKSIVERENYDSPLKDLASMLRSISYRVYTISQEPSWVATNENLLVSGLVNGYLETCQELGIDFLPCSESFAKLLLFFQVERVVYECDYEMKYRPDWLDVPLQGLLALVGQMETMMKREVCP